MKASLNKACKIKWLMTAGRVGGPQDFSVNLSPLGTNWVFEHISTWLGLGLVGFGTKGLGQSLDKICN